jgi:hypothetical protein
MTLPLLLAAVLSAAAILLRRPRAEPFLSESSAESVIGVRYTATVGERQFMFSLSALEIMDFSGYAITEPPPLSAADVLRLSENDLLRYVPPGESGAWLPESVALSRCRRDKWYFSAVFRPVAGGLNPDGTPCRVEIPVLFNRMVVRGVELSRANRHAEDLISQAEHLGLPADPFLTDAQRAACNVAVLQDITVLSGVDANAYEFRIASESMENSGDHEPAESLPLGFDGAAAAALKASALYLPAERSERWQVVKVALIRWGNSRKWYYLVEFESAGAAEGGAARLRIPVLMNGDAVSGRLVSES